jgi:tetratricopeptide (TPR) repeat protein
MGEHGPHVPRSQQAGGRTPRIRVESAIEANPNDVLAYCHLGFLSHVGGDLTEAMRQYKLALAIDPNSSQAHYNMGLAFAEARIFEEALREWELVIKNDPDGELGKTAAENVRIIQQYTGKP